jgi:putative ABC transport system permease protein
MLLIAAGLVIRSFLALESAPLGFDSRNVLVVNTAITGSRFDRIDTIANMVRQTEERLRAIPGVDAVSAGDSVPLLPNLSRAFVIAGVPGGSTWRAVTPKYFSVFRIPVIAGRSFLDSDNARSPRVVVINQAMARRYWPNKNPIGQTLDFTNAGTREPDAEVIGMVADAREISRRDPPGPVVYVPLSQVDDGFLDSVRIWLQSLSWTIRTGVPSGALIPRIQQQIRDAAGLPAGSVRAMDEIVAGSAAHEASQTTLLSAFALVALLLAAVGLHGMLAYSAQQRRYEFGIRLALGADPAHLRRFILWQGVKSAAVGIPIGIAGAFALSRLLRAQLFAVSPADPFVFTGVPLLLGLVVVVTSYLAARRVSAIDPARVMKCE